ncbi:MAG: cytochrome c oxidase assembly protein [Alphaproteobacteria bacterium]|nr:cytochrome c oxidase assembly protein [Alphaproteobacteria bacterium]
MVALVVGMVGVSYLSVPLYQLFCQVTGWSGTPGRYSAEDRAELERIVPGVGRMFTVRFDANTNRNMAWDFAPVVKSMDVELGQQYLAYYRATNLMSTSTTGTATFNVTPLKLGRYFVKVECFCFTEQTLGAKESVEMPVSFYIDPAIQDDPILDDVKVVTLSYTFFPLI